MASDPLQVQSKSKIFPTKVTWAFYIFWIGWAAGTSSFGAFVRRLAYSKGDIWVGDAFTFGIIIVVLMSFLVIVIAPTSRYEITETELCVHQGMRVNLHRIPLDSLVQVAPVKSSICISYCQAAFRGLRVNYQKADGKDAFILISPRDRKEFLRELERRCPHLVLSGDRLAPVSVPKYVS